MRAGTYVSHRTGTRVSPGRDSAYQEGGEHLQRYSLQHVVLNNTTSIDGQYT